MSDVEEILNKIRELKPESPTVFTCKTSRKNNRKKRKQKSVNNKSNLKKIKEFCFKGGEELIKSKCDLFLNNPLCEKPLMITAEDTDSLDKDILSRSEWDYYESSEEIIDYSSGDIE